MNLSCPCGTGRPYAACCEPYHLGQRDAETAETLMRSRYGAYALGHVDYIVETTHPAQRATLDRRSLEAWSSRSDWKRLEILEVLEGEVGDERGIVEFVAHYEERGIANAHHERSAFTRLDGRWYFDAEGSSVPGREPARAEKRTGRNDPCPCGSGKKFKKCCG